jgi:hypothetical protein
MSKYPFTPPEYQKTAFNCPFCNAFSAQTWSAAGIIEISFACCSHCGKNSVWHTEKLIFPVSTQAPPANVDLPPDLLIDYNEASSIVGYSPRGAAM